MKKKLSLDDINAFRSDYAEKKNYKVAERAVTHNGIYASATDENVERSLVPAFSIDLDAGKVTNQKHSGRCWMFAGLNVIRVILMKKLNCENIELSQAYLQFYDKLEKANFFFERVIELAGEPVDSRLNVFMLDSGIGDGGHFVMFTNLVKKYGVMPISAMPDYTVSTDTTQLNNVLSEYLAQGMMELRAAKKKRERREVLDAIKEKYLKDIYRILSISIGVPPETFTFEYKDKDKKFHRIENITPKEFYKKYIGTNLDDYVSLCDAPIEGRKMYTRYLCHYVNNVEGGDPVFFFNVDPKEFKEAAIASLKGGDPIWFGSDVLAQSMRKSGKLGEGLINTNDLFDIDYHMDKKARLTYRTSFCNHAMTLTGVNLIDDKPNRWKVENSWGKENGEEGFFTMSDEWFDQYVYQIFVNKKYISKKLYEKYLKAPKVEVEPFDTLWALDKGE